MSASVCSFDGWPGFAVEREALINTAKTAKNAIFIGGDRCLLRATGCALISQPLPQPHSTHGSTKVHHAARTQPKQVVL